MVDVIKKKTILLIMILLTCQSSCKTQTDKQNTSNNYKTDREYMVKNQLEARGITNKKVLNAFKKVERHLFVPDEYKNKGYGDYPLPIGEGQTISQPYIVAYMTDILNLKGNEKVLEIGTGSGYQAAILAELCDSVFTIEIFPSLGNRAKKLLDSLGYKNIKVKISDGYMGWQEHSPFDAIIVTCAPTHVPQPLKNQLVEGGKMIIPVGDQYIQNLYLLQKSKGEIIEKAVLPVRFVPMIDENQSRY
jgi:protein-L-isoaspartate(D-aspartate) O-methyltransferase